MMTLFRMLQISIVPASLLGLMGSALSEDTPSPNTLTRGYIDFNAPIDKCRSAELEGSITKFSGSAYRDATLSLGSLSGDISIALSIYSFLKTLPLKNFTTYNRSGLDFAELPIFLAGANRTVAPGSNFFFRKPLYHINNQRMTEYKYRIVLDEMEEKTKSMISLISSVTGMDYKGAEKVVRSESTISAEEAIKLNIATQMKHIHINDEEPWELSTIVFTPGCK